MTREGPLSFFPLHQVTADLNQFGIVTVQGCDSLRCEKNKNKTKLVCFKRTERAIHTFIFYAIRESLDRTSETTHSDMNSILIIVQVPFVNDPPVAHAMTAVMDQTRKVAAMIETRTSWRNASCSCTRSWSSPTFSRLVAPIPVRVLFLEYPSKAHQPATSFLQYFFSSRQSRWHAAATLLAPAVASDRKPAPAVGVHPLRPPCFLPETSNNLKTLSTQITVTQRRCSGAACTEPGEESLCGFGLFALLTYWRIRAVVDPSQPAEAFFAAYSSISLAA
jgi:hypothetical protein